VFDFFGYLVSELIARLMPGRTHRKDKHVRGRHPLFTAHKRRRLF
jgi:hypothetical protein